MVIERRSALAAHPMMAGAAAVASDHASQLHMSERRLHALLQVSAFASEAEQVGADLAAALGLPLPAGNRLSGDTRKSLRAVGPGVWLVVGELGALPDATTLRATLAARASVVDLGQARCALQLRGAAATRTLAKFCGLDLDPSAFPTGSATNTRFGHVGMHLARVDDVPTYELLVFRGYAEFVFDALCEGAAEFGFRVEPSSPSPGVPE